MWLGGRTFPERRLRWSDRWETAASVRISTKISITGKTTVYAQAQQGGKPITLQGWVTQEELGDLQTLYSDPGQDYTLIFDSGEQFPNVIILSIDSNAVLEKKNPLWINVTVNMMTVVA